MLEDDRQWSSEHYFARPKVFALQHATYEEDLPALFKEKQKKKENLFNRYEQRRKGIEHKAFMKLASLTATLPSEQTADGWQATVLWVVAPTAAANLFRSLVRKYKSVSSGATDAVSA